MPIMWNLKVIDVSKPLYLAVVEAIERDIASGVLQPGDRMPTHRKLAQQVGITTSTASRVYHEAGRRGLITAVVGRGTFITADAGKKLSVIDVNQRSPQWDMGNAGPLSWTDPDIRSLADTLMQNDGLQDLMSRMEPQGLLAHREAGAEWVSRFGVAVPPERIVITAGAHHALFIICNSLLSEDGCRLATDCLTYPGIKTAAQRNGIRLEGVGMDEHGMRPDELDSLCRRQKIKGIYLSGRIQNPTNREMPAKRRMELRNVIAKHGLTLIENDPYGFLGDAGDRTLSALLPDSSIYISSVSKAFYPGLRIAFAAAAPHLAKRLTQGVADSMLSVSPFCAEIASLCIQNGMADIAINNKRQVLAERRALFQEIFADHVFWSSPESQSVWLKLPRRWNSANFETEAERHNIRLFGAKRFAVGAKLPPEAVHISLTGIENFSSLKNTLLFLRRLIGQPKRPARK